MKILLFLLFSLPIYSQFGSKNIVDEDSFFVRMLQTADFDNDGDEDIVVSSFDLIAWYENVDGLGTFGPPIAIQEGKKQSFALFPADLNGDERIDLLVSFFDDDEVLWYRNLGGGSFSAGQLISEDLVTASGVRAADLDGDNDLDIILGTSNGSGLYWVENLNGLGSFGPRIVIDPLLDQCRRQDVGDIDGDGDLDILSNSASGVYLSWFENVDGMGTFATQHVIDPVGLYENSLHLADIDDDDDLDIVSQKRDAIIWRENLDGLGTYGAIQVISTKVEVVFDTAVGDIDNDGNLDVVSASTDDNKIAWYKNKDGNGGFGPQQIIDPELFSPRTVVTTDIDGDGDLDVVSAALSNEGRELVWYENLTILGVESFEDAEEIVLYPNPTKNIFYLNSEAKPVSKVTIYDRHGRLVYFLDEYSGNIDIGHLANGFYLVKVLAGNEWFTLKIVKD